MRDLPHLPGSVWFAVGLVLLCAGLSVLCGALLLAIRRGTGLVRAFIVRRAGLCVTATRWCQYCQAERGEPHKQPDCRGNIAQLTTLGD